MGNVTAKTSGDIASFMSPAKTNIKSLKVHFSPKQLGEGDPSPENVREIVGWDGVEVNGCGKNLFDKSQYIDNYRLRTDGINYKHTGYYISSFIPVVVGETYIKNSPLADAYHRFCTYSDADVETFIRRVDNSNTITIESGESYIRFCGEIEEKDTAQVELGSTATSHEPYQDKQITSDWSSEIGTVYGGYVDLISGELVEEYYSVIENGQKSWSFNNYNDNYYRTFITPSTLEVPNPIINSKKQFYNMCLNGSYRTKFNGWIGSTGNFLFYLPQSLGITTNDEWANFLSINPLQICYPLAEPITHQLTPTQLSSFIGQNNFWSNADYVEIEYELKETEDIQKCRKKIILNQPHIESIKDNSISFNTDLRAPLKECKVYFEPVQEGEGDLSPDNVRNITGWNGVEVKNGDNVYSIDWINDVGTVYGGYVNLVKGEVVAEWEMAQGKWGDIKSSTAVSSTGYYTGKFSYNNTIKKSYYQSSYYKNSICNITNTIIWQTGEKTPEHFYCGNNSNTNKGEAYIFGNYDDDVTIQIIVKLAEPIHYSLTPQQILSLKGINNFSCGIKNDLSVRYWNYKKSNSSNIAYEAKNLTFDGTNYIDTGVYLFSEKNINRDFEVVIEDLYGGDSSNKTIVCAKYDSTAIGFLIRLNSAAGTIYNGTISMKTNNHNNITIKRINSIITIEGEIITNPKVKITNAVHQHPLVLGCALQDDGIPFRYQAGTIGHITVKWL